MIKKHYFIIVMFLVITLVIVSIVFNFYGLADKEVSLQFSEEQLAYLNQFFDNTTAMSEFAAILVVNNNTVEKVVTFGYKNIINGKVIDSFIPNIDVPSNMSYTLHSHKDGTCFLSIIDEQPNIDTVSCVMCSKNKVRCFQRWYNFNN